MNSALKLFAADKLATKDLSLSLTKTPHIPVSLVASI